VKAVRLTRRFHVLGGEDLDGHTDQVMDELLALESDVISDADVSVALTDGIVEISIVASGEDFDAALDLADATIRTAIHAADGHTPQWTAVAVAAEEALVDA